MSDLKKICTKIQAMRDEMQNLIEQKNSLLDPEVLTASRMLDVMLNEYNKMLNSKIRQ